MIDHVFSLTEMKQAIIDAKKAPDHSSIWSLNQLWRILRKWRECDNAYLYLHIDAIDEIDCEPIELVNLLNEITEYPKVKVLAAGRYRAGFDACFDSSKKLKLHELTEPDILRYVIGKLNQPTILDLLTPSTGRVEFVQLITEIVSAARGRFQWVKLVVESLLRGMHRFENFGMLIFRLREYPQELQDLYVFLYDENESRNKQSATLESTSSDGSGNDFEKLSSLSAIDYEYDDSTSLISLADSRDSGYYTQSQPRIYDEAVEEFVHHILSERPLMNLFGTVFGKTRDGEKVKRNFAVLLGRYARRLRTEASKKVEVHAANMVSNTSVRIAHLTISQASSASFNTDLVYLQKQDLGQPHELNLWLQRYSLSDDRFQTTGENLSVPEPDSHEYLAELEAEVPEEPEEVIEDAGTFVLNSVKVFLFDGEPFRQLIDDFQSFVHAGADQTKFHSWRQRFLDIQESDRSKQDK